MIRTSRVIIACAVTIFFQVASASAISVRTVALSSGVAPGGGSFFGFSAPLLNEQGRTAFFSGANTAAIYSEGTGPLALVAKVGDPAAGLPGATFNSFSFAQQEHLTLNDHGDVAFYGVAFDPNRTPRSLPGVWQSTSSGQSLLYHEGDTFLPASSEVLTLVKFDGLSFNNSNVATFVATGDLSPSNPSGTRHVLLNKSASTGRIVARSGTLPPAMASPANFSGLLYNEVTAVAVNDNSHVAFQAIVDNAGTNNTGIWAESTSGLHLVALRGNLAPGFPGKAFQSFTRPGFNNAGHTVFQAVADVNSPIADGIWSDRSGKLQLIAGTGTAVPGLSGATLRSTQGGAFSPLPQINGADRVVFAGRMTGATTSTDAAIFSDGLGSLAIVAREGDQVPGAPVGTVFTDFMQCSISTNCGYSINGNGQVAFLDPTRGLFAQDIHGVLREIARIGGTLEVAPGDFRTITSVSFQNGTGNEDGRASAFNNLGQIAFRATFGATSGVFVSDVVAIPEPTTFGLLIAAAGVGIFWPRPTRNRAAAN